MLFSSRRSYPSRLAQKALGHNSKAVHHAYSKHAEVTVPSLDDWERSWQKTEAGGRRSEGQPDNATPRAELANVVELAAAAA